MRFRVEYTDKKINMTFKHIMGVCDENELIERIKANFPSDRYEIHGWVKL